MNWPQEALELADREMVFMPDADTRLQRLRKRTELRLGERTEIDNSCALEDLRRLGFKSEWPRYLTNAGTYAYTSVKAPQYHNYELGVFGELGETLDTMLLSEAKWRPLINEFWASMAKQAPNVELRSAYLQQAGVQC